MALSPIEIFDKKKAQSFNHLPLGAEYRAFLLYFNNTTTKPETLRLTQKKSITFTKLNASNQLALIKAYLSELLSVIKAAET